MGHRDKGLADLETGSTLYMSEFLDFNQEVGEECDENTEEDLAYLQDPSVNINLIVYHIYIYIIKGHAQRVFP
jgi:hypothetical protein